MQEGVEIVLRCWCQLFSVSLGRPKLYSAGSKCCPVVMWPMALGVVAGSQMTDNRFFTTLFSFCRAHWDALSFSHVIAYLWIFSCYGERYKFRSYLTCRKYPCALHFLQESSLCVFPLDTDFSLSMLKKTPPNQNHILNPFFSLKFADQALLLLIIWDKAINFHVTPKQFCCDFVWLW